MSTLKKKTVSYKDIKHLIPSDRTESVMLGENEDVEVKVKKYLSFGESIQFVNEIVSSCFGGENDTEYYPESFEQAVRGCVIGIYTNIKLPDDIEEQNNIVFCDEIYDKCRSVINVEQFDSMVAAAKEKIRHRVAVYISTAEYQASKILSAFEEFSNLIDEANTGDVSKIVNAIVADDDMRNKFSSIIKENGGGFNAVVQ